MKYTLKMLRASRNWSQLTAAMHVGVSVDTWGNWERKRSFPDVPHIKKIQEVFNVAYDDIIFLQSFTVKPLRSEDMTKQTKNDINAAISLCLWLLAIGLTAAISVFIIIVAVITALQIQEVVMNKMCITVAEAAELASVPETVIREWAQDFDFPSMKIGKRGGKRLIHSRLFDEWLAKRCQARIGEQKGSKNDEINLGIKSGRILNGSRHNRINRN